VLATTLSQNPAERAESHRRGIGDWLDEVRTAIEALAASLPPGVKLNRIGFQLEKLRPDGQRICRAGVPKGICGLSGSSVTCCRRTNCNSQSPAPAGFALP
jgi:hypothetical protein